MEELWCQWEVVGWIPTSKFTQNINGGRDHPCGEIVDGYEPSSEDWIAHQGQDPRAFPSASESCAATPRDS